MIEDKVVHPEEVEHPDPPAKDRMAAWIAEKCSTVEFLLVNAVLYLIWMIVGTVSGVDHFPFPALTLILSLEAIALSIFVLVQQRLGSERSAREAQADLKNDALAAEETQGITEQLNRIEALLEGS